MYDSRKTKRKKGGGVKDIMAQAATGLTNKITQKVVSTSSKIKKSMKSDRLDSIIKGTNVKTFCCNESRDTSSMFGMPSIFGDNKGEKCVPSYTGLCNEIGSYSHKYRCFNAKYYPMVSEYPGNIPSFPSKPMGLSLAKDLPDLSTKIMELERSNADINNLVQKNKAKLRVPTLEEFKNSKKLANAKWYSLLTNRSDRNKKIKDVPKEDFNALFKNLYEYAKSAEMRQMEIRCSIESKSIIAEFKLKKPNSTEKKDANSNNEIITEQGDKLISVEDSKEVKVYIQRKGELKRSDTPLYIYEKPKGGVIVATPGKLSNYIKRVDEASKILNEYINKNILLKIMLPYQRYAARINEHFSEVTTALNSIIEHQGFKDNYVARMTRYIALVKNYVEDRKNEGKTVSDALYHGLYDTIYERNYNSSSVSYPEHAECQHVSKFATKIAKITLTPGKLLAIAAATVVLSGIGLAIVGYIIYSGALIDYISGNYSSSKASEKPDSILSRLTFTSDGSNFSNSSSRGYNFSFSSNQTQKNIKPEEQKQKRKTKRKKKNPKQKKKGATKS